MEQGKTSQVWRRPSLCDADANCVEVAYSDGEIQVRDSKNPLHSQLHFSIAEWAIFIASVFRGEFDLERLMSVPARGSANNGAPATATMQEG